MPRKRLSRKESQAHTRACLMQSAARLFARRGLEQSSIEDVAEDAGYSKGAFYANFKNKEELFLAMLDERFSERLADIDRALASDESPELQAQHAGDDFAEHLRADPEWQRLFFEFAAYATRNEEFRQELATRLRSIRDRTAELYRRRAEAVGGGEPPVPMEDLALMTCAMANGLALDSLLDPKNVSDEHFGTMMLIFFAGVRTLMREAQAAEPAGTPA